MAQVIVRNLDARTVAALKLRAQENGRSLEAELRLVLARVVGDLVAEPSQPYATTTSGEVRKGIAAAITLPKSPGSRARPVKRVKVKGIPTSQLLIQERR